MKNIFPLILLFLLSSCGAVKHLVYKPALKLSKPNSISVAVSTLDLREHKDKIGVSKFTTSPDLVIHTKDDVSDWVTKALLAELKNAGYQVGTHSSFEAPLYSVRGELKRFCATSCPEMREGKIVLEIQVFKNNALYFQKEYLAKMNPRSEWNIFKDFHTKTLEELMQQISQEFISDFNQKSLG